MDHAKEDSSEEDEEQFTFNPNLKPFEEPQTVCFTNDSPVSMELLSRDVTVVTTPRDHCYGSPQVKTTNIVDFSWDLRFYTGQLLAVHVSGDYLAYGIKAVGTSPGGVVKVLRRKSNDKCLLKHSDGMIQDIAFAHILDRVILASVDELGTLMVHSVEAHSYNNLVGIPLVHLVQDLASPNLGGHRVIWCPYMPEEEDGKGASEDDASKLLCLMHGNNAQLLNVGVINKTFGKEPIRPQTLQMQNGFLEIKEHMKPIVDASFSPDGTAIATVSEDGYIKFFQVDMNHVIPIRCLHEWQPHGDKPLSLLAFVDNHKSFTPHPDDQFWKFCITGAENNSELKFWSCETWTCLQTVSFTTDDGNRNIMLKASLDLSGDYLIISDIYYKLLYVLQIYRYPEPNQRFAYIRSVSQFLIPYPILSFGIVDAGIRHFKSWESLEDAVNEDGDDELNPSDQYIVIKMYLVQPKSLQEGRITFLPLHFEDVIESDEKVLSRDTLLYNNEMSIALGDGSVTNHNTHRLSDKNSPTEQATKATRHSNASPLMPRLSRSPQLNLQPQLLETKEQSEGQAHFASGGSSPSREVQEIFSLNSSAHNTSVYYDENDLVKDVNTAVAKLSMMNTPPREVGQQYDSVQDNSVHVTTSVEADRFPPIPPSLVNEARKSIGEDGPSKRHGVSILSLGMGDGDPMNGMYALNHQAEVGTPFSHAFASLMDVIQQQSSQLQKVGDELAEVRKVVGELRSAGVAKSEQDKVEMEKTQHVERKQGERLEKTISHSQQEQIKTLKQLLKEQEKKIQDNLLTSLSQYVRNLISSRLPEIVADINHKQREPVEKEFQARMSQIVTNTERHLKEQITNAIHSKNAIEELSQATAALLSPSIYKVTQEAISHCLVPSFEKCCHNMFKQISDTFNNGVNEFTRALIDQRDKDVSRDLILNELNVLSKNIQSKNAQLASVVSHDVSLQVLKGLTSFHDNVIKNVNTNVRDQINRCFQKQQASIEDRVVNAVRSGAITPAPHMIDTQMLQAQISQLVAKQDLDSAFNLALGASDLSLVVFACEQVNPQQLFNQVPLPLQANTLMALIQQLSADMSSHTVLKHKYLEGAVMYMGTCTDPEVRVHLRPLFTDLQQQLSVYLEEEHPNLDLTRSVKMLFLVTKSLLIT